MDLRDFIRDIPDFPKPGIVFKDIMPLLLDPGALKNALDQLAEPWRGKKIQKVASAEARGFIFGPALAIELDAGFVAVRKPGKLPYESKTVTYDLEYGTDSLAVHTDSIHKDEQVLMVDDLLATGGTMGAAKQLVEELGGEIVGASFLIELGFLNGREKLPGVDVKSVIHYGGE